MMKFNKLLKTIKYQYEAYHIGTNMVKNPQWINIFETYGPIYFIFGMGNL